MKIAALIPTIYRPQGLILALQSLKETAPDVYPVIAVEPDDIQALIIARKYRALVTGCVLPRQGCAYAWNTAFRSCLDADIYVIGSDDMEFKPKWLDNALDALYENLHGSGVVGFHDNKHLKISMHYMMTRDFIIEYHGGVAAIPHYYTWCVDTEAMERAKRVNKWYKSMDSIVLHHWGGPDGDDTYKLSYQLRKKNKELYFERQQNNFPDDFEPILTKEAVR